MPSQLYKPALLYSGIPEIRTATLFLSGREFSINCGMYFLISWSILSTNFSTVTLSPSERMTIVNHLLPQNYKIRDTRDSLPALQVSTWPIMLAFSP